MTRISRDTLRLWTRADVTERRALVTGAGGFVGQWLCRDLVRQGWHVVGSSLTDAPLGVLSPMEHSAVDWRLGDLRDSAVIERALTGPAADAVFHLAGIAYVPAPDRDPTLALDINVSVALQLLHELRLRQGAGVLDPAVVMVGSAEQYGRHDLSQMPLPETAECAPRTMYAATKYAQEIFALEAFRSSGLRVVCTRSFNHSGPGQEARFLLPSLVTRALEARRLGASTLVIGNAAPLKDFLHVEDAARAYVLLAERGRPGEVYNVCSGNSVTVGDVAKEVLTIVGVNAKLVTDDSLRRSADIPALVGSNRKICSETSWSPRRTRAEIILDLIHAASH